jgi:hypothetical protein
MSLTLLILYLKHYLMLFTKISSLRGLFLHYSSDLSDNVTYLGKVASLIDPTVKQLRESFTKALKLTYIDEDVIPLLFALLGNMIVSPDNLIHQAFSSRRLRNGLLRPLEMSELKSKSVYPEPEWSMPRVQVIFAI